MKFKVWSDLHIEGRWFDYEPQPEDKDLTLILAGDIGTIRGGLEAFLIEQCDNFNHVIFLFGNHEFYSENMNDVKEKINRLSETIDNLYILDNDHVIIEGVRILGSTLYTQLTPRNQEIVRNGINDYRVTSIDYGYGYEKKLTPRDHNYMYEQSVLWLRHILDFPFVGKTMVVTHWSPTNKLTDSQFIGNPFNPYFCNDLEWMMHSYNIDTWVYGHTHGKIFIDYKEDERFDGTRLINNPRGYSNESANFEPNRIFEI